MSYYVLQVSVQCQEGQLVLHGLVFDNVIYTTDIQPHLEEDNEDEEIHEDDNFYNDIQNLTD